MKIPFKFTGVAIEYFNIWIVNLLLTILTLGIYSAWAKVRTKRYFYSNTFIGDSSFEYHATPLRILKARLVVAAIFIIYLLLTNYAPVLSLLMVAGFYLLLPALIWKSFTFTARYSSWRNIRFDFDQDCLSDAYKNYLLLPILIPFTLFIILPYITFRHWKYYISNGRFGTQKFSLGNVAVSKFYGAFFLCIMLPIIILCIVVLFIGAIYAWKYQLVGNIGVTTLPLLLILLSMIFFGAYKILARNLALNSMTLSDHNFESTVKVFPFFKIHLTNLIMIIITLGIFVPWAKVRMARYLSENLILVTKGDLDSFVQSELKTSSALGAEGIEISDTDVIGL